MKSLKISLTAIIISGLLAVSSFAQFAVSSFAQYSADHHESVVDLASGDERFSTLVSLLEQAGLVEILQNGEEFTIFAPTNDAFAEVPQETLDALQGDVELLREVLLTHVIVGTVPSDLVAQIDEAPTAAGNTLPVSTADGVQIGNATVTEADLMASNGVIHVVDAVIMPPQEASGY
jgi:uncharacterized surface protein with fasciclin (FAS1) repeats